MAPDDAASSKFKPALDDLAERRGQALSGSGPERYARLKAAGKLNARQRLDHLLDPGSFQEVGLLAHSDMPGEAASTPYDSKVAGYGRVEGRQVGVVASDFTVKAGTSSRVAGHKERSVAQLCARSGRPYIYLGEAGGARMPDIMGAVGLATYGGNFADDDLFVRSLTRLRSNPLVTAILGDAFGEPTWMAYLADFVVMTRNACMAVSGPRVLEVATGETIDPADLGGWKVHASLTGMVDAVADDDAHALALIRQFLSYMPSHNGEAPPSAPVPAGSGHRMAAILDDLPERNSKAYDIVPLLERMVDTDSLFQLKPLFGRSIITALARLAGRVVGFVANQPRHLGGALDTDAIDKAVSFLCLCDSYNIPLVFFHDMPGFLVGLEPERKRAASKIMTFLEALGQVTVPKIAIIVRKSYGMAFYNMAGTGTGSSFLAAWPTAEVGFVSERVGLNVVYASRIQAADDPEVERERLRAEMLRENSPYALAGRFLIHDVIAPAETRDYLARTLALAYNNRTGGVGQHLLANWPKKF